MRAGLRQTVGLIGTGVCLTTPRGELRVLLPRQRGECSLEMIMPLHLLGGDLAAPPTPGDSQLLD
jgi:hypothetical protein